jgi:catechol 2,3-dioxygenase-like lactoylglutathione lyase family enzyme
MIGYITLGTSNLARAIAFYDALMATADIPRLWHTDTMAAWAKTREDPALCLTLPFDKEPAGVGNGAMVALKMQTPAQVDALHAKALELGGTNEGSPGPRGSAGFYAGYFRDLDGNKLNAYVMATSKPKDVI